MVTYLLVFDIYLFSLPISRLHVIENLKIFIITSTDTVAVLIILTVQFMSMQTRKREVIALINTLHERERERERERESICFLSISSGKRVKLERIQ